MAGDEGMKMREGLSQVRGPSLWKLGKKRK